MESKSNYSAGGCQSGKTVSPRLQKLENDFIRNGGCFKEFRIGDLFYVKGNPQLNKESFTFSKDSQYPYFTRTVFNNGIYDYADYLDKDHLIEGNSLAVGMMACKFFYMEHDFYAGQFTKTCFPKFNRFNEKIATYFISLLNCYSDKLKGVLVRDFEATFSSIVVDLPSYNDELAFDYMECYIRELEQERIRELDAYLKAIGLNDYELTPEEKICIEIIENGGGNYKDFKIGELFNTYTGDVDLQNKDLTESGEYFINSGVQNQGIKGRTSRKARIFSEKTLTIDFFGNCYYRDFKYKLATHNHVFSLSSDVLKNQEVSLYVATTFSYLRFCHSFNEMLTQTILKNKYVVLPITMHGDIDYQTMELYVRAIEKLCIRSVVDWKDKIIETTRTVVS